VIKLWWKLCPVFKYMSCKTVKLNNSCMITKKFLGNMMVMYLVSHLCLVSLLSWTSSFFLYLGPERQWCEDPIVIARSIILLLRNESHFWGPKRAWKLMKLYTWIRSGENLRLIWAWQSSMFRHETGSCCNLGIQCRLCPKLHMFY